MSFPGRKSSSLPLFLLIAGIPFLIFGILSFRQISAGGETWKQRKTIVDSGAVEAREAVVIKKRKDQGSHRRTANARSVTLRVDGMKRTITRAPGHEIWDELKVGDRLKVYPFGDDYFIPVTDRGGHGWGRWTFLGFGALPLTIGLMLWTVRVLKRPNLVET